MGISNEIWGIILSVIGIILAVYFGFKTATYVKSKRLTQNQKVGSNSNAIQSGRDTKVGK